MHTALLIPVKNLGNAKQRLGDAFDQEHRSLLAEAMLRDVLTAAAGVAQRLDVYLVTGDARGKELAGDFGFRVIEDTRNESETAAIEMATAWCEASGYNTTVVIPGDVPLTTIEAVNQRRSYSVRGIEKSALGEQQAIADTFFEAGLIPARLVTADARIWTPAKG